jgi:hypothetical protein
MASMEAQRILIKLHDESAGYAVTPDRLPLSTLKTFANEVADFLRGDLGGPELAGVEVAVVEGSLGIWTAPLADAALWADLRTLARTDMLDSLSMRRRKVVERWQAQARPPKRLRFEISSPGLDKPVVISSVTDFRADDADQWVRVERYVRGEIEDLGGSVKANAHIRLPDGKLLTVDTDRALLREDKLNRLYKPAMVRIRAEYNVVTREYRDARLVEFVEHDSRFDEREFTKLTDRGAKAWKDVPDASAWVEALRGQDG